jgi:hypothetical protein
LYADGLHDLMAACWEPTLDFRAHSPWVTFEQKHLHVLRAVVRSSLAATPVQTRLYASVKGSQWEQLRVCLRVEVHFGRRNRSAEHKKQGNKTASNA